MAGGLQMTPETKGTNPKDAIGSSKLNVGLVPATGILLEALAFTEGAQKYGRFNWRVAGVRASVYFDAAMRHMYKWYNGEWGDPETKVPHLASARACLNIILDAQVCGKLTDDRPPICRGQAETFQMGAWVTKNLQNLFAEQNPHQYTIADQTEGGG